MKTSFFEGKVTYKISGLGENRLTRPLLWLFGLARVKDHFA